MSLTYNTELPGYVRNVLPYNVQTAFRKAFNAELRKGASEKVAIRRAWYVLKQDMGSMSAGASVGPGQASNIEGNLHLPGFLTGKKKKKKKKNKDDLMMMDENGDVSNVTKKLPADANAAAYIHDFVNSSDPRFKDKSKAERIQMALGAYYGKREPDLLEIAKLLEKALPRTLYVSRSVVNAQDIISWAKEQGFKTVLKPKDLHVTIAYSSTPVDWMKVSTDGGYSANSNGGVTINAGGARLVEPLGDEGAVVLLFTSDALTYRHNQILGAGASWDFQGYQPHITITWDAIGVDLKKVEPYTGEIVLGPEIFAEVDNNWADNLTEKRSAYATLLAKVADVMPNSVDLHVVKVDPSLGLVFGWAIVCKRKGEDYYDLNVDRDGTRVPEHITEQAMLESSSDFMQHYRVAKDMHTGDQQGTVVFAFPLTTDIAKAMGIQTDTTGLLVAMKPNPELLGKFASGELKGFSIGGSRVKVREYEVV
jgi:cation transport regulator ChaB